MKSWKTINGYKIIQVLSGRSNSYFITTDRLNILLDTGKVTANKRLRNNIGSLKLERKKIDFLVLTHTHFDHCQNAAQIKKQENCKIIMSAKEKSFVEKGYTPVPYGTTMISKRIYELGIRLGTKRFRYAPFIADRFIVDEFEFIDNELDIRTINTPGHSAGSMSILVDNEIAIVGDTLFGIYPNSVFPPFADNPVELIDSWHKLLETDCILFLPGHGKAIKRDLLQKEYYKFSQKFN